MPFPKIPDLERRKMRLLRQILFAAIIVIGFSLTASAQDDRENREKPKKKERVEIKPEDKKPKNNENRDNNQNNNKGKKPQAFFLLSENKIEITSI